MSPRLGLRAHGSPLTTPQTMPPRFFCSGCGHLLPSLPPVVCATCGTAHWSDPKPCASGLVTHRGRLLMVRRANDPWRDYWDVPGGFCGTAEHPITTAEREVLEETGLRIKVTGFLGMWIDEYGSVPTDAPRKATLNIYYHATPIGRPRIVTSQDEVAEARWF